MILKEFSYQGSNLDISSMTFLKNIRHTADIKTIIDASDPDIVLQKFIYDDCGNIKICMIKMNLFDINIGINIQLGAPYPQKSPKIDFFRNKTRTYQYDIYIMHLLDIYTWSPSTKLYSLLLEIKEILQPVIVNEIIITTNNNNTPIYNNEKKNYNNVKNEKRNKKMKTKMLLKMKKERKISNKILIKRFHQN